VAVQVQVQTQGQSRSITAVAQTRRRLIETAERLFAEHGPDGVSLRQISAAAGQSNNFAVQYHFGTREGLLDAIVAHRLPRIDAIRSTLLGDVTRSGREQDVRALLDVLFWPLAHEARDPKSWYVSFLTRTQSIDGLQLSPIGVEVAETVLECLTPLPVPLRITRLQVVTGSCLFALAGYEQRHRAGRRRRARDLPFDAFVIDLLDGAEQALSAPLSPATRAALAATPRRTGDARA
jgi:AcrR family transcriptional regulator